MIKLSKRPEPAILQNNAAIWLQTIEDKIAVGEAPTDGEKSRYRHPEIKAELVMETHGKCAYCEAKLLHITYGDVEHISPKSNRLADTFRWDNLTLACDVCNTNKSNKTDLVDPYVDDPSEFFKFFGPFMYAIPQQVRSVITLTALKLNRAELMLSRAKRLEHITQIVLTISQTKDHKLKEILVQDLLQNEATDECEYAAATRSLLIELKDILSA